jgi:hypothetical protein
VATLVLFCTTTMMFVCLVSAAVFFFSSFVLVMVAVFSFLGDDIGVGGGVEMVGVVVVSFRAGVVGGVDVGVGLLQGCGSDFGVEVEVGDGGGCIDGGCGGRGGIIVDGVFAC